MEAAVIELMENVAICRMRRAICPMMDEEISWMGYVYREINLLKYMIWTHDGVSLCLAEYSSKKIPPLARLQKGGFKKSKSYQGA
jgi:hypothetical protein